MPAHCLAVRHMLGSRYLSPLAFGWNTMATPLHDRAMCRELMCSTCAFLCVLVSHSSERQAVIFSLQQINHLLDRLLNPAMFQLSNLEQDEVQRCKEMTGRRPRGLYGLLSNSAGADSSQVFTIKWHFTAHGSLTGEFFWPKGIRVHRTETHLSLPVGQKAKVCDQ